MEAKQHEEIGRLFLRGVRADLWRRLRIEAVSRGLSMGAVMNEVLAARYEQGKKEK